MFIFMKISMWVVFLCIINKKLLASNCKSLQLECACTVTVCDAYIFHPLCIKLAI